MELLGSCCGVLGGHQGVARRLLGWEIYDNHMNEIRERINKQKMLRQQNVCVCLCVCVCVRQGCPSVRTKLWFTSVCGCGLQFFLCIFSMLLI